TIDYSTENWLSQQPAFHADARAMDDLRTLRSRIRGFAAEVRQHVDPPAMVAFRNDNDAMIRALAQPGEDPRASVQLTSDPQFKSVYLANPAAETAYRG